MQQHLPFPETPCPHEAVWAQLNDEQQQLVIAVLARLIAATQTTIEQTEESTHE